MLLKGTFKETATISTAVLESLSGKTCWIVILNVCASHAGFLRKGLWTDLFIYDIFFTPLSCSCGFPSLVKVVISCLFWQGEISKETGFCPEGSWNFLPTLCKSLIKSNSILYEICSKAIGVLWEQRAKGLKLRLLFWSKSYQMKFTWNSLRWSSSNWNKISGTGPCHFKWEPKGIGITYIHIPWGYFEGKFLGCASLKQQ